MSESLDETVDLLVELLLIERRKLEAITRIYLMESEATKLFRYNESGFPI